MFDIDVFLGPLLWSLHTNFQGISSPPSRPVLNPCITLVIPSHKYPLVRIQIVGCCFVNFCIPRAQSRDQQIWLHWGVGWQIREQSFHKQSFIGTPAPIHLHTAYGCFCSAMAALNWSYRDCMAWKA